MLKRRRKNKRLDAPHVRMYRWMLDSPAYLSLTCAARAVLIDNRQGPRRHEQRSARIVCSSGLRAVQHRSWHCPTRLCRTPGAWLHRLHDEGNVQPEGPARHRMAADLVDLRRNERTSQQEVHELGPRKTKHGIKISRRGIKSEPACSVNHFKKEPNGAFE